MSNWIPAFIVLNTEMAPSHHQPEWVQPVTSTIEI